MCVKAYKKIRESRLLYITVYGKIYHIGTCKVIQGLLNTRHAASVHITTINKTTITKTEETTAQKAQASLGLFLSEIDIMLPDR